MAALAIAVLGFLLTGVVGNWLLQRWQYRSWVRQKRFSGVESEYIALRDLISDLSKEIGKRLFRMNRLFYAIKMNSDSAIDNRLAIYDESVVSWNEQYNGLAARLTVLSTFDNTKRLENKIVQPFQLTGHLLETAIRKIRSGSPPTKEELDEISVMLKSLQRNVALFDRDMLNQVVSARNRAYFGYKIEYNPGNLDKMSNFELIKALFASNVDLHSISRAP